MDKKDLKILFMGTPEFALPTLNALYENYTVVAAVTRPDSPKGRGHVMQAPPVKEFCLARGIPVLQPVKVRTDDFPEALASFGADVFVTCAYGRILTQKVLDIPPMGTVNVHASLLPKYRGAAPLWWQVINGEEEAGVTTMLTDIGMDTGDILLSESMLLGPETSMGELHDALAEMGAGLIVRTLDGMLDGSITPIPQDHENATYAPMVSKDDGIIDWKASAKAIHDLVRGMDPTPAASTVMEGENIKIFASRLTDLVPGPETEPGTVLGFEGGILVACGDGVLAVTELQARGSRRMDWKAYTNGHAVNIGTVLGE